jgi:alpha-L-fucosidase
MSLNDSWGFNKADHHWKSARTVIQTLVDAASKGGNLLLNVGAESDGTFPPEAVSVLNEIGQWMSRYGDSIYGTYPAPPDSPPAWGRITRTGNTFYLHVFNWPGDGVLTITGLGKNFRHASILGDPRGISLAGNENGESITLTLPSAAPNPIDSVVVMECQ